MVAPRKPDHGQPGTRASRRAAVGVRLALALPLVVCVLTGCSTQPPSFEELGTPLVEYPGVGIAQVDWLPNGSAVIWQGYLAGTNYEASPLYLTDARTGDTRALGLPDQGPYWLQVLDDSDTLVYTTVTSACWYRYSISTGERSTMHCDDNGTDSEHGVGWFASLDGLTLGYYREYDQEDDEGLYLHDTATGVTRYFPAVGLPGSYVSAHSSEQPFSPNGRRLVVAYPDTSYQLPQKRYGVLTLATGDVQPLPLPLDGYQLIDAYFVNWTPSGIKVLVWSENASYATGYVETDLLDVTTGTVQRLDTAADGPGGMLGTDLSLDGSAKADVSETCLGYGTGMWGEPVCNEIQGTLWVLDIATRTWRPIAWYNSGDLMHALSADGTKIAYFMQDGHLGSQEVARLYVAQGRR